MEEKRKVGLAPKHGSEEGRKQRKGSEEAKCAGESETQQKV
jgi:hypothetical protein